MDHSVPRRRLLQGGVATALASAISSRWLAAADPPRVPRVDAHLHCFAGKDDKQFPYDARGPYKPEKAATPEHLLTCMAEAGVDYAIVVHPEPYQDDHRYLEHCLAVGKGKLKGTILLFADRPGSLEKMQELCHKLPIVAVRVHAYAPDRLPPFGKPELKRLWQMATDNGLAVQLHFEPRYASGFGPLIREFPKTKVIIDHMGRPFQGTPEEHAVVLRWATLGNTVMKLSAIPEQTMYPHRDIGPIVRQLTDAWGAERMIYGGGFGSETTGASYRAAFERTRSYLSHLSVPIRRKFWVARRRRCSKFGV